ASGPHEKVVYAKIMGHYRLLDEALDEARIERQEAKHELKEIMEPLKRAIDSSSCDLSFILEFESLWTNTAICRAPFMDMVLFEAQGVRDCDWFDTERAVGDEVMRHRPTSASWSLSGAMYNFPYDVDEKG